MTASTKDISEAARGGAAPAAREHRVPDFFIVGQPKSGTTALHSMLRRHPQIYMPLTKEPGFLADELQVRTPPRPEGTPRELDTPKTLEDYLAMFDAAEPGQRAGEATPFYLWSRTAAARIAELAPAARIIAILREPASLLHSLHLQLSSRSYVETEPDFRRALELERERAAGREIPRYTYWPGLLLYSEQVRYVEQLRRYEALFAPEQLLVLIYDDFRRDNEGTLRAVLRFLDVDETHAIDAVEVNRAVRVRSQRLHRLVHAVSVGHGPGSRAAKAALKTLLPRRLRREALVATQDRLVYAEPRPPDEGFMRELRRRFKGEVVALSEHLDRDLVTLWGYDELG